MGNSLKCVISQNDGLMMVLMVNVMHPSVYRVKRAWKKHEGDYKYII